MSDARLVAGRRRIRAQYREWLRSRAPYAVLADLSDVQIDAVQRLGWDRAEEASSRSRVKAERCDAITPWLEARGWSWELVMVANGRDETTVIVGEARRWATVSMRPEIAHRLRSGQYAMVAKPGGGFAGILIGDQTEDLTHAEWFRF